MFPTQMFTELVDTIESFITILEMALQPCWRVHLSVTPEITEPGESCWTTKVGTNVAFTVDATARSDVDGGSSRSCARSNVELIGNTKNTRPVLVGSVSRVTERLVRSSANGFLTLIRGTGIDMRQAPVPVGSVDAVTEGPIRSNVTDIMGSVDMITARAPVQNGASGESGVARTIGNATLHPWHVVLRVS